MNIFGWYSPTIILMKVLLQRLWELNLRWDKPVPDQIEQVWNRWHEQVCLEALVFYPELWKVHIVMAMAVH